MNRVVGKLVIHFLSDGTSSLLVKARTAIRLRICRKWSWPGVRCWKRIKTFAFYRSENSILLKSRLTFAISATPKIFAAIYCLGRHSLLTENAFRAFYWRHNRSVWPDCACISQFENCSDDSYSKELIENLKVLLLRAKWNLYLFGLCLFEGLSTLKKICGRQCTTTSHLAV